jgi:hypothetical protein
MVSIYPCSFRSLHEKKGIHVFKVLLDTLDNIATPCSVNTYGSFLVPPQLDVSNPDIKISNSVYVNWKRDGIEI